MKYLQKPSLLIAFFAIISLALIPSDSESPFLKSLKGQLTAYTEQLPEEKVYIHTDRSFYLPGEDMWFKVYVANGQNHHFSLFSAIAYAELIDPRGNVAHKWSLRLESGIATADFNFHEGLAGGIYKLRCYTNWMKNAGEETFFEKEITVQKVVKPRLLMKLEFRKRAYASSDWVEADFDARNLEDAPLANREISFVASLEGKKILTKKTTTDLEGKALIRFQLPENVKSTDGLLNILIENEGNRESISRAIPITLNQINLAFFPEGGDLVENVTAKLAFKATNEFNKAADISGQIVDDLGKVCASFESFHLGLGACEFKPESGRKYFAKLSQPSGNSQQFALPKALKTGYQLAIPQIGREQITLKFYAPKAGNIDLIGQTRGQVFYSATLQAKVGWNEQEVSVADFPTGIAQFTLFDADGEPHAERLTFLNRHQELNIKISTDKTQYAPREMVKMEVETTNANGEPIPSNLSLAVIDDKLFSLADDKQHNIMSWLLAGSDLKGKIEEPNFYFKNDEPKAAEALDLLLLTQGWRRFTWAAVQAGDKGYTFSAEQAGVVSGTVVHISTKKPVEGASVELLNPTSGQMTSLKTSNDGRFTFLGADPINALQLLASSEKYAAQKIEILLDGTSGLTDTGGFSDGKPGFVGDTKVPSKIKLDANGDEVTPSDNKKGKKGLNIKSTFDGNISLEESSALEEVIVIGYGVTTSKSALTSSVTSVDSDKLIDRTSWSSALEGRVAGIQITSNDGTPGAASNINLRGISSISGNNPLFVIDGVPRTELDVGELDVSVIENITVLKGVAGTALYGSRAANGVILITTTQNRNWNNGGFGSFRRKQNPSKFAQAWVYPIYKRSISKGREFFSPDYAKHQKPEVRTDFRNTIFWEGDLQTDKEGRAEVVFYNSDANTVFRTIAEGISISGDIGRVEHTYSTLQQFSLTAKMPTNLTYEDQVRLPVILKNASAKAMKGNLKLTVPPHLKLAQSEVIEIDLPANNAQTVYFDLAVMNISGTSDLLLEFSGKEIEEKVLQTFKVTPKGFPVSMSVSGQDLHTTAQLNIDDIVEGSLQVELVGYTDLVGQLMDGVESMLRQPHGCFEQVSSSTYPNVMVLNYLKNTNKNTNGVESKALAYIADGYKRLAAYEVPRSNGFSLYGRPAASTWLTAYGLMEFTDMQKVYGGVDDAMIARTINYLLQSKDGNGGFKGKNYAYRNNYYSQTENAYVIYALSESGKVHQNSIGAEYRKACEVALSNKNPYHLGLMANAAFNYNDLAKGNELLELLIEKLEKQGLGKLLTNRTITYSYGYSAQVEAASLAAMALLKQKTPNMDALEPVLKYILSKRSGYGSFGSTQATVLALKALTAYATFQSNGSESGKLQFSVNGKNRADKGYVANMAGNVALKGLAQYIQKGGNELAIDFVDTQKPLPFSLTASWTARTPNSHVDCEVGLSTELTNNTAKMGETVRLTAQIQNRTNKGLPSTVALIGIPSGLSLQAWQLKKMIDEELIDFYEIQDNYLILYYIDMKPSITKTISLDLKAEIPGKYQAPASTAYLYYADEFKDWQAGTSVEVTE